MSRRRATADPAPPPALSPVVIAPNAVFTAPQVRQMLGLRQSSLRREIKQGRLRVSKRCGRYYFMGGQLLDWLRDGEMPSRPARHHERNGTPAA